MTQEALPQEVEQLKIEANALYTQGSFLLAIPKYSAAIEKVPDNAILYANRAACYIALEQCVTCCVYIPLALFILSQISGGKGRCHQSKASHSRQLCFFSSLLHRLPS